MTGSRFRNDHRGGLDGAGQRHALVVSRFNAVVTDELLDGAVDGLRRHGVDEDDIEILRVPGAWELPAAAARLVERGGIDSIVALGCVIRGETPHFEFVAGQAAAGLGDLAVRASVPVIFGVLTTDTLEQALARAGSTGDDETANKGWEAAISAIEMVNLFRRIR